MSSLSQEESRSISENVRCGIKKRMADGKYSVTYSHFIGYDRGPDGGMVINENEANIVRFIFRSRLQGYSDTVTARRLTELGVPAPYGGEKWSPTVIGHMLSNEKMKGDALIQKSYTTDFLVKRQRKNRGEVPQYYVSGGHEAIIDARQAKAAWGTTDAYKEYEQKSKDRTREEEAEISRQMMDIFREFGEIRESDPGNPEAQALVKKLQDFITKKMYTCTKDILSNLGQM